MQKILQALYSAIRCPLNHQWKLTREAPTDCGVEIEHVCLKCGKQTKRFIAHSAP